ncbi:MAG: putative sulfate exporter family transporter [Anaerolineaceae bacterium]|nr:putative sulfate exporter family transporter [Anaerolineaceae bacterium]
MNPEETTRKITAWEQNLLGVPITDLPKLIPGMLAVSVLTWASIWISEFIGKQLMGFEKSPISPVMLAIILGLLIGVLIQKPKKLNPGIKFAVKKILRLGIILLGIRLTIFDVLKLGVFGVPIVALCIVGALMITTWINNKLKLPERLGTLIAVGTSICGVTAIVAASPAIDAEEEESAYAIAVITVFGLFATLVYPYFANLIFAGDAMQVGLFLGTSVHETAQVVGAGQIYADIFSQPNALDAAIITKLVRNVFMAAVIPFMAFYYARKAQDGNFKGEKTNFAKLFPVFILGFLAMAIFRSFGDAGINAGGQAFGILEKAAWSDVIVFIKSWAEICLVVALAGVGLSTDFHSFKALGIKPFIVGLCASAAVGGISFLAIKLLGSFVVF